MSLENRLSPDLDPKSRIGRTLVEAVCDHLESRQARSSGAPGAAEDLEWQRGGSSSTGDDNRDGRIELGVGRPHCGHAEHQRCRHVVASSTSLSHQYEGAISSAIGALQARRPDSEQVDIDLDGQCGHSELLGAHDRSSSSACHGGQSHSAVVHGESDHTDSIAHSGCEQLSGGSSFQTVQRGLGAVEGAVQRASEPLPTSDRLVCRSAQHETANVREPIQSDRCGSNECAECLMEQAERSDSASVCHVASSSTEGCARSSDSNDSSSVVAQPTMVPNTTEASSGGNQHPQLITLFPRGLFVLSTGASEKPRLADGGLSSVSQNSLEQLGCNAETVSVAKHLGLKQSTLRLYERSLLKLAEWASDNGKQVSGTREQLRALILDYKATLAKRSNRPQTSLDLLDSAIKLCMQLQNIEDLFGTLDARAHTSIVSKCTTKPRLPKMKLVIADVTNAIASAFKEPNSTLPLDRLRSKLMMLLSMCLLLRPSDAAVLTVPSDTSTSCTRVSFGVFNNKTDTNSTGYVRMLPRASRLDVDPIDALLTYLERSREFRSYDTTLTDIPVFVTHKLGARAGAIPRTPPIRY